MYKKSFDFRFVDIFNVENEQDWVIRLQCIQAGRLNYPADYLPLDRKHRHNHQVALAIRRLLTQSMYPFDWKRMSRRIEIYQRDGGGVTLSYLLPDAWRYMGALHSSLLHEYQSRFSLFAKASEDFMLFMNDEEEASGN
jgi:hypothetical protein